MGNNVNPYNHLHLVLWYLLFGALHELSHLLVAVGTLGIDSVWINGKEDVVAVAYRIFVGRYCVIHENGIPNGDDSSYHKAMIRHAGWIVSCLFAIFVTMAKGSSSSSSSKPMARWAAILTALEAISTDLLGGSSWIPLLANTTTISGTIFYCGNFGIILLSPLWFQDKQDQGKAALECLETMVHVTMMRGAQSGGVVSFTPDKRGIRSRVVNKKRTDLSQEILKRVRKDFRPRNFPSNFVPTLVGHTRFATSSRSTLDGTHPHQWTPTSKRRVYNLNFIPKNDSPKDDPLLEPKTMLVENYVTHNGDFDFYSINGNTYDLEIVQKWLSIVTETPTPTMVDSCAIAGVIDLLRTQGCFGLSARYAICFALSTSKMQDNITNFPNYNHFEAIGMVFEDILKNMTKGDSDLTTLGDDPEKRTIFAQEVVKLLREDKLELIQPLMAYIVSIENTMEEAHGANLFAFCKVTIDAFFDNDLLMTTKHFLKNAKGSFGLCVTCNLDSQRQLCLAARGQTVCFFL